MSHETKSQSNRPVKSAKKKGNASAGAGGYTWEDLHNDLEHDKVAGVYGGCNSAWFGLSEIRGQVNMEEFHKKRSKDEIYNPDLDAHLKNPYTQRRWKDIVSFDPMGMYATRPTMAATTARMNIPELSDLDRDGKIVNEDDGSVNIIKAAVDYVWNIPGVCSRLGFDESLVRDKLHKYTKIDAVKDTSFKAFVPPLGGLTIYFIGDPKKLADKTTEVAVRVHDSCCGSDVFGTDICTCRPYLMFAVKAAVECAQRGGVGVIIYFQKEGRSLGEVTKFRVYNARKNQSGGDTAEKYFHQTESIAGIRDARFQELMPDALLWLGIERIDWLLSMSSEKYDAITSMGIKVMQRVALPDTFVPAGAGVEIHAKVAAGYHTDKIDSAEVGNNLRSLDSIRQRCEQVYKLAVEGKSSHLNLNLKNLPKVVNHVVEVTKKNYPDLKVPYHSRWRHFLPGTVEEISQWKCDPLERCRRLIDLATISVLLDAGAGPDWKYVDRNGNTFARSEGLAIASFDMFCDGMFSSDEALPHRVNASGLAKVSLEKFSRGMQASKQNKMAGLEGRYNLLHRVSLALQAHPEFFGYELSRPGNIVDYVLRHADDRKHVSLRVLWKAIIEGFETIWPDNLSGIRRGDVWVYNPLKQIGHIGSDMVPFHKLSQWLTLSLLEPMESVGIVFDDTDLFTGLAEYRNGGLFIDHGVLSLKNAETAKIFYDVGSELVVEWRALTVVLLDKVAEEVRKKLKLTKEQLPLPKVLQGGTWQAGREIARKMRPGGGPPINIRSDGSVF